ATCDYLTASAHKFSGLKGVGILKAPSDFRFLVGGEQESGRRAGTENYPGVAAMLAALEEANAFDQVPLLEQARDAFEETLLEALPGLRVLGKDANRLWNSTALLMPVHENLRWVGKLEKLGHEVSTGSACATGKEGPSHVAAALGLSPEEARRIVRVSGSRETLPEDWVALAEAFRAAFSELQAASSSVEIVSV
ncbi:MAG: aminotransferase class V-fold PLP-dependent enzyme, partial [Opitutales bacterium]